MPKSSKEWKKEDRNFHIELLFEPEHTLACLSLAMHIQVNEVLAAYSPQPQSLALLYPRVKNSITVLDRKIHELDTDDCGCSVGISGSIIQCEDETTTVPGNTERRYSFHLDVVDLTGGLDSGRFTFKSNNVTNYLQVAYDALGLGWPPATECREALCWTVSM